MMNHCPTHVAIVGCGFTGTTALYQLVDRWPVAEITVFEESGSFGPGYAYGDSNAPTYLINNSNDAMCLVPSNRGAFLAWLRSKTEFAHVDPKGNLERRVYGSFLEEVIAATRVMAAIKGISIHLVAEQVTDVIENADGTVIVRSSTGDTRVQCAILATGRCPDLDRYGMLSAPAATYLSTHIPGRPFDTIRPNATVHVLGTSLSAYDVVNRLYAPETGCRFERNRDGALSFVPGPNERVVVLASRNGRLKKVASRCRPQIKRTVFTEEVIRAKAKMGGLTLQALLNLVIAEAEAHGAYVDWIKVLDPYAGCSTADAVTARATSLLAKDIVAALAPSESMANFLVDLARDAQVLLWDIVASGLVPPDQEALYRRSYESSVLSIAAPCSIATAERLLALMRSGRLSILCGVGEPVVSNSGHYLLPHAHGVETADVLINATGAVDRSIDSPHQPALYRSMAARGVIKPHDRGHGPIDGIAVDRSLRPIGLQNVYIANMLLWGPGFFTSSAFMMATLVDRILASMYAETQNI